MKRLLLVALLLSAIQCFAWEDPKCPYNWEQYLQKNLRYPSEASKNYVQGRVVYRFTINENGQLTDIQIVRCAIDEFKEEVLRVLKWAPKWIPARNNQNKRVSVNYIGSINFSIK